ncbi:hypothetical protein J421_4681 (plasmid) [Gemmatirosa kalamazoonensis]|uniref:Uncharacterized protein n=1 Tax=Gemmatirosa kalamazoonensis TaxID=861299 RepID=W0RNA0_9BACT|nr:hypothetical protein [Gemmatirosa kalamazoonensis]AHG92149.1 hypothetical protein J421_4614 [Gemmatirosa kalamazoonensis]AHG92216.1 hypothetical protein J421_4681 [Gemmatirosa kalamazoonensis]
MSRPIPIRPVAHEAQSISLEDQARLYARMLTALARKSRTGEPTEIRDAHLDTAARLLVQLADRAELAP